VYGLDSQVPMTECYRYDELRFAKAARFLKGKSIDYGCGLGYFSKYCSDNGFHVDGCDWSEVALELAKKTSPDVNFYLYDGVDPFLYECISFQEVIEHMDEPEDFLKQVKGRVIITTPRKNEGGAMCSAEHIREYSAEELAEMVEKHLKIVHFEVISAAYGTGLLMVADKIY
jgi:2-polyprenyl-3-methyl-5-hydroxy-6-metoxy-1,4-benzoquinol methylase